MFLLVLFLLFILYLCNTKETLNVVQNVAIVNYNYNPKLITINVGTDVIWTNYDSIGHTITTDDGYLDSPLLDERETFTHTFDKAGTYEYYCIPHPFMRGVIKVVSPTQSASSAQLATQLTQSTQPPPQRNTLQNSICGWHI